MSSVKPWTESICLIFLTFAALGVAQEKTPPGVVLTGEVTGAQNKTYFEVPFTVPAGTQRISVDFQYTGKEERANLDLFSTVEVINGGQIMLSSAKYWDAQLRDGHRLAAIGGSDSHNATQPPGPPGPPGSIGWPTTAVEADELSVAAILKGIRAGRTFVDLTASHDKQIDIEADSGSAHARMGGTLTIAAPAQVHIEIHTAGCAGSVVHLLLDGKEAAAPASVATSDAGASSTFDLTVGPGKHWLRSEVRDNSGKLLLVSSPLYINFPK